MHQVSAGIRLAAQIKTMTYRLVTPSILFRRILVISSALKRSGDKGGIDGIPVLPSRVM